MSPAMLVRYHQEVLCRAGCRHLSEILMCRDAAKDAPCVQGGIVYSNVVTTVSPTYAKEALEGGAAGWLRATLAKPEVSSKFKVRFLCKLSFPADRQQ